MTAPVRVAVVGAGYWGPNLIRTLHALSTADLQIVCDKSLPRLEYVRQRYPTIKTTPNLDDVLHNDSIEAVFVATPVSTHRAIGGAVIESGKHAFIEKPLASTTDDARYLVRTAARRGRLLAAGHIFVHHAAIVRLRQEINSGRLGQLLYGESARVNLGPPASEIDVVWDLAVHDISISLSLAPHRPVSVAAVGRRCLHPTLTDVAFIRVEFPNGYFACHHVSWLSPIKVRRFFVAGSDGSAVFDDTRDSGKLAISDLGIDTRIAAGTNTTEELYYSPGDIQQPELSTLPPLTAECDDFLCAIRGRRRLTADGEAGLAVVSVLEAASRSIASGGALMPLSDPDGDARLTD